MLPISKTECLSVVENVSEATAVGEIHIDPYGTSIEADNGRLYRITSAKSEAIYSARLLGYRSEHLPQIFSIVEMAHEKGPLYCIEQELWRQDGHSTGTAKNAMRFLEMNGLLIDEYEDIESLDPEDHESFLLEPRYEEVILAIQEAANTHRALGNYTTEVDSAHVAVRVDSECKPQAVLVNQLSVDLESKLSLLPHFTLHDFVEPHPSIARIDDPSVFERNREMLVEEDVHELLVESLNLDRWQVLQPNSITMKKP